MSNKRERIVDAAIESFSKKGIDKTTISDIAKQAGVAQGTYYLYFPSKFSIMPAIASVLVNKIQIALQENVKEGTVEVQIKEIISIIFNVTHEHKELSTIIYSGLTQTEHISSWNDIYSPVYEWINTFLLKHQQMGNIRATINIDYTSIILITLIESLADRLYLYGEVKDEQISRHKQELNDFINHALGIYS